MGESNREGSLPSEAIGRESESQKEAIRYLVDLVSKTTGKFIGVKSDCPTNNNPYVGANIAVDYLHPDTSTLQGELGGTHYTYDRTKEPEDPDARRKEIIEARIS